MKHVWFAAALVLVSNGAARAETNADCTVRGATLPSIPGCTKLIDSGAIRGRDLAIALNARGQAYVAAGQYDLAIADYTRGIQIDPGFVELYVNRALAEVSAKAYTAAISDSNTALRIDPSFAMAYLSRAFAYSGSENYDAAIKDYTTLLEANPNNATIRINRGSNYFTKDDYGAAITDYTEALSHDPYNAIVYRERGTAAFALKRFPEAIRDFSASAALERSDAYTMLWLYLARQRARDSQAIAANELAATAAAIDLSKWPGPVVQFYLGKITEGAMTAAAKSPGEVCEAVFYTAEWNTTHAQMKAARDQFARAVKACPVNFNEAHVARAELTP